jgi:hypothetical protein
MATTIARHGGLLATLAWNLQPLLGSPIRIEENANGCVFVVRAEVPGIEPKDISVMVADGKLKIEIDRVEAAPGLPALRVPIRALRPDGSSAEARQREADQRGVRSRNPGDHRGGGPAVPGGSHRAGGGE